MRRVIKWFIWPLGLMALTIALLAVSYHRLLQAPATTIEANQAAGQRANLAASKPSSAAKREQISEADLTTLLQARSQTAQTVARAGVGRLAVPAAQISLPVFNLINETTLSTGAVMYFPERGLGRGNTVLASHHYLGGAGLLNDLDKVKAGQTILLSDLKTVWRYRVVGNQVVKKDQVAVLANTADARITLIRCEGPRGTIYRRVVTGLLTGRSKLKSNRQAKALGITKHRPAAPSHGLIDWLAAALARTIQHRQLDGWLWLLLLMNVVVLFGCAAGYVLIASRPASR